MTPAGNQFGLLFVFHRSMNRLLLSILVLCLPVLMGMQTVSRGDTNARIKAVFMYNFTRYIEWPETAASGNFVINVFGSNTPLVAELNNLAKTKTVGTQKIEIRNTTSLDAIGNSHILFVCGDNPTPLSEILTKIKGKNVLLVTEKPGYARLGSAINFVVVQNKQKFELNKANAEKYNLKVSTTLVQLGIPVE
ncbi:MAG: YfiR family protein [Bacteroidetes bacterium]|nr:YfiR family protein [Bacteroidota bacterium]